MRYAEVIREAIDWRLPPAPGTAPIPDGDVRLYHQTSEANLGSIKHNGIQLRHARGFEGPKAIYADERGFYGKPGDLATVEFHVPRERWDRPFVVGDVAPEEIIAVHRPWHRSARYIERNPKLIADILAGKRDDLLDDHQYGKPIRYIKHKYRNPSAT